MQEIEREFRRYFYLAAASRRRSMGLKHGPVDNYWHTLITCTSLYHAFCKAGAGRYIHHDPAKDDADGYALTYEAYIRVYGDVPPTKWWPEPCAAARARIAAQAAWAADSLGSSDGYAWLFAMSSEDCGHSTGCGDGSGGDGDGGCGGDGCGGGGCGGCGGCGS